MLRTTGLCITVTADCDDCSTFVDLVYDADDNHEQALQDLHGQGWTGDGLLRCPDCSSRAAAGTGAAGPTVNLLGHGAEPEPESAELTIVETLKHTVTVAHGDLVAAIPFWAELSAKDYQRPVYHAALEALFSDRLGPDTVTACLDRRVTAIRI